MAGATYKSFSEALKDAFADIRSRWTGARLDKVSMFDHIARVMTGQRMSATGYAKNRYNSTRPDLATGEDLVELARDVYGVTANPATTARWIKTTAVCTGTGAWGTGLTATNAAGLNYVTVNAGAWYPGSIAIVYISSTDTGEQCNLPVGAEVTLAVPPIGMDATLTVTGWHTTRGFPARDAEKESELQTRLSDQVGGAATSSNAAAYQSWCLSDTVKTTLLDNGEDLPAKCFIYPGVRGILDVSAVPMLAWNGITMQPSVAGTFLTDIEDYVDDTAPRSADFDAVQFTEDAQSIRVTLDTDTGYGRDWGATATTSMTTHAATACTSTRIYLVAGHVTASGIAAGDRILCHVGTNFYPNVRVAASVDATNDYIDLDTPLRDENGVEATVALGDIVRPAGPVSQAVVDAILEMYSNFTPSDTAAVVRYPPISQLHPVDMTVGLIHHTIRDASEHIFDVTINTPAAGVACTTSALGGGVLVAYVLSPTRADDWCRVEFTDLNT